MDAYRPTNSQRGATRMGDLYTQEASSIEVKISQLEPAAKSVLLVVADMGGVTNKAIRERTGLTIGPVNRLAGYCVEEGLFTKRREGEGDKSPWVFYLNTNILDRGNVLDLLERWGVTERVKQSSKQIKKSKRTHKRKQMPSEFEVPKLFKPIFSTVKSSAREALWEAFLFVAQTERTSARDLCKSKGWSSSVGSERLRKLMKAELIDRDLGDVYLYFITEKAIELCNASGIYIRPNKQSNLASEVEELQKTLEVESTIPIPISSETMSNKTLNDLASAVKLLTNQIVQLNQRMAEVEKGQKDSQLTDFNLEEIKRQLRSNSTHNSQQ